MLENFKLDADDRWDFNYHGTTISVINLEFKMTIQLMVNGAIVAESKGVKALTGVGDLRYELPNKELVVASVKKIQKGDTTCKVTVNNVEVPCVEHSHEKKDIIPKK